MRNLFINKENIEDGYCYITGDDAHHLLKVLRYKVGDEIIVSDGEIKYRALFSGIKESNIILKILQPINSEKIENADITLFQGLPKADKMEFIIQKCTEIGVNKFIPVNTKYSVVNLNNYNTERKISRWRKIAVEASKQSGRFTLPEVLMPINFSDVLDKICDFDLFIVPYEKETNITIKHIFKDFTKAKRIGIFIGPEGGFSVEELEQLVKNGAISITLGPNILRTETAAIVVSAIIMHEIS
ncbi:MAG: RsmE family RNA methyltransferase [Thermoanaerobacteraceae bacterium]